MTGLLGKGLRLLASLKVAIPLLVVLTVATVVISLFPTPEMFSSYWYLGLLGLLGVSLLLITIQHAPLILRKKGRNAMIGVIATHLGILVVIAGIIYGGFLGFRHQLRLVEGEVTVIPGLPFVIRLDGIEIEEYRQEEFPRMNLAALPKKTPGQPPDALERRAGTGERGCRPRATNAGRRHHAPAVGQRRGYGV